MTERQYQQQIVWGSWGLFAILTILVKYHFAALTRLDRLMRDWLTAHMVGSQWEWDTLNQGLYGLLPVAMGGLVIYWWQQDHQWAMYGLIGLVLATPLQLGVKFLVAQVPPTAESVIWGNENPVVSTLFFYWTWLACLMVADVWRRKTKHQQGIVIGIISLTSLLIVIAQVLGNTASLSAIARSFFLSGGCWLESLVIFETFCGGKTAELKG
ncbi:hypothetical protein ACUIJQ_09410 [Levilactobacillus hammesii]|uniref:Uncharacterized protein n=1 Tax=Levilactobacillus hammesii DSM 16381 TaxID=1423753 RepID=A0A0R1UV47_9LACO|nr:hypothetical protein [Levilactobacillus hammesii]KRL95347.1 hypothetical protein FD28_GL002309 [Levilactobacillus hammesii DSM 16381]